MAIFALRCKIVFRSKNAGKRTKSGLKSVGTGMGTLTRIWNEIVAELQSLSGGEKMPSPVGQVSYQFDLINKVGESKRAYMNHSKKHEFKHHSPYIHNYKTLQKHLKESKKFVGWAQKEYGIKSIYQLEQQHHQAYIEKKEEEGLRPGSIVNIESALNSLQRGMKEAARHNNKEPVIFFKERLYENDKRPSDRSYSRETIEKIQESMPEEAKDASILSIELGLRPREAANIRVEHFLLEKGKVYIPDKKTAQKIGVKSAQGITKGGRHRKTNIPNHLKPRLEKMLAGKDPKSKVVGLKQSTLSGYLNDACKGAGVKSNGWHGFRHTFSREYFDKIATEKEKENLQKAIQNKREGYRADKGILRSELREMKEKANQVMNQLGHGDNRWEQIETYLG